MNVLPILSSLLDPYHFSQDLKVAEFIPSTAFMMTPQAPPIAERARLTLSTKINILRKVRTGTRFSSLIKIEVQSRASYIDRNKN